MEQYWQELQQQVHRKAALERKQEALCEQWRKLKEELDTATQRWQEEQKDVDKLEGISLAGIFSALSGRKEEQLEKERQEAQEALVQKEAADNAFQKLEEEIRKNRDELFRLQDCEIKYQRALEERAAELEAMGQDTGLLQLQKEIGRLEAEDKELQEVLDAGRDVHVQVQQALNALDSAENWGVVDMMGGGMMTTMMKRDRMNQAKNAMTEIEYLLRKFRAELSDIAGADTVGAANFGKEWSMMDYLMDGFFIDYMVQQEITESLSNMRRLEKEIERVCATIQQRKVEEMLCKKREELRAQQKQLEEKMLELSVQYSRETQDVKELEGLTMTSLLSSLSGTKQKNLEKERREAKEAALRLEEAKKVLEQVERELQSVDLEVRQLRGSKEKYETALKEKAAQMEAAGIRTGFSELEEKLGILETESIEVTDVLQLGNALRWQLHRIMEILQSARNWGRVDLIGGGSTSSALKRERMEETRKALAELDVILGYFRKKFRETPVVSKISYEEWGDDLFAADFLLDGFVIDALVQVDIVDCQAEMERLYEQTERICKSLRQKADGIQAEKESLQKNG